MDELVDVSSGRVGFRGRGGEKQETGLLGTRGVVCFSNENPTKNKQANKL